MAQADGVVANGTGSAVRSDINNQYAALWSNHSGSTEPSSGKVAYQFWADTNTSILKIRNSANNAWINLFTLAGGVDVDAASNFNEDVTFTGAAANVVWDKSADDLIFNDNAKAVFGTSSDGLEVYHNGNNSFIEDSGTGDFYIRGADNIRLQSYSDNEDMAKFTKDAGCQFYHNNVVKCAVNSTGIEVSGGIVEVKGTEGGEAQLKLKADEGDDNDDQWRFIAHVDNGFDIANLASGSWEKNVRCVGNANTSLYYDNSVKVQTTSSGGTLSGTWQPDTDDDRNFGASNRRFDTIYATNGTINTSDRNEKNSIIESDLGLDFVNKLKPVSYKWNKNNEKTHYGLIAQDIEETVINEGKKIDDFACINKPDNAPMGLNYNELISPLVKAIQELSVKVAALEAK
mgnify:CR=1 FL=1|tara:strand:+ start:46 stop:1251 length:1206 start_codon:yes stop_codon:yes gene_type:complete